jgi:hypothetical protein
LVCLINLFWLLRGSSADKLRVRRDNGCRSEADSLTLRDGCLLWVLVVSKRFAQKRFKLRETLNEPFFDFDYARIAAISG